jgi:hypothetical protein
MTPDFSNTKIKNCIVHHVGNRTNGEELFLSKNTLTIEDQRLHELLLKFFLSPFQNLELFSFTFSNEEFQLNPVYNYACDIFNSPASFLKKSKDLAKLLYETSNHPQIKAGDLFIVRLKDVQWNNQTCEALGIFKSENRQDFLQLEKNENEFILNTEDGINPDKLDKGCLIFNLEAETGLRVAIIDKANKSSEAQFWRETFLNIKPCRDEYHYTKEFLNIARDYVTKQLHEDFEVNKADQIDLLNKSVEYFKKHENFDKNEFEKEVFQDKGVIKSFREFDQSYREVNEIEIEDQFEISPQAVKKQNRIFKSVLKLDKNFHVYIHGDRELIEHGVDKDGRKFYKIYYEEER